MIILIVIVIYGAIKVKDENFKSFFKSKNNKQIEYILSNQTDGDIIIKLNSKKITLPKKSKYPENGNKEKINKDKLI